MLYFFVLIGIIECVQGHHSLPVLPNNENCAAKFGLLFQCVEQPSLDNYIHQFTRTGVELQVNDDHNAYRTVINETIVNDVCRYLQGIAACMERSKSYIQHSCPSKLVELTNTFIRIVPKLCIEYKTEISDMIQCANQNNDIMMTYGSCVKGAYDFITTHQIDNCHMVDRFRVCHCQFDTCFNDHTSRIKDLFTQNYNEFCFLFKLLSAKS